MWPFTKKKNLRSEEVCIGDHRDEQIGYLHRRIDGLFDELRALKNHLGVEIQLSCVKKEVIAGVKDGVPLTGGRG